MQGNLKMSQRAHNVDATSPRRRLLAVVNPHILRMFKGTFSLDVRVAIFLIVCFGISVSFRYFGFVSVNLGTGVLPQKVAEEPVKLLWKQLQNGGAH